MDLTQNFTIVRDFTVSMQRVWDAWTRAAQLSRWFGPKGTRVTVQAQDLRPGGTALLCLTNPDDTRLWAKFVYREVTHPRHLVWVHSFSDPDANVVRAPFFGGNWPLELLTEVAFLPVGHGARVTLTCTPLDATDLERQTFAANEASMTEGWTGSFDVLASFLEER